MSDETSNEYWDHDNWGDPKDYGVDPIKRSLAGFTVGDRIRITEDFECNGQWQGYEGDTGTIVGITQPFAGGGVFDLKPHDAFLSILLDDYDEPTKFDPAVVEDASGE